MGYFKPYLFSSTCANRLEDLSVKADLNSSWPIEVCLESSMFVINCALLPLELVICLFELMFIVSRLLEA